MKHIHRSFRLCGDSLSCWFSPQGSLSTAVLVVNEKKYHVTPQLIGLDADNCNEYLKEIGFRSSYGSDITSVSKELNNRIRELGIVLENVVYTKGGVYFYFIRSEDRHIVCPQVLFVIRFQNKQIVVVKECEDTNLYKLFLQKIKL